MPSTQQKANLTTGTERDDLRARTLQVCAHLRETLSLGSQSASKEGVSAALTAFANADLNAFSFFNSSSPTMNASDMRQAAYVIEALASESGSLASIYLVNAIMAGSCIAAAGTEDQRHQLLPQLRDGAIQVAFAMTEPEAGSDAASMRTTAIRTGTDGFQINGEKLFATGAATADQLIVVARTDADSKRRSFGLFCISSTAPGLEIEPLGDKLAAGIHATCRLRLKDVPATSDDILGGVGQVERAWQVLRYMGMLERLSVAALSLGLASAIVVRATDFARSRKQFGQSIASFQAIEHMLVEMLTDETGMRLFVENALSAFEAADNELDAATQAVCMAKWICAERLQSIVSKGMRIMGGRAYFGELSEMERYYREAPFSLYAGGTIEIQKMLIARTMKLTDKS